MGNRTLPTLNLYEIARRYAVRLDVRDVDSEVAYRIIEALLQRDAALTKRVEAIEKTLTEMCKTFEQFNTPK